jgi:hypothetical protein
LFSQRRNYTYHVAHERCEPNTIWILPANEKATSGNNKITNNVKYEFKVIIFRHFGSNCYNISYHHQPKKCHRHVSLDICTLNSGNYIYNSHYGKQLCKNSNKGFWIAFPGIFLTVLSLFVLAGFNITVFYPSTFDLQSSPTIQNCSSSDYTLAVVCYVSLLVPLVVVYIWYVWKLMTKKEYL